MSDWVRYEVDAGMNHVPVVKWGRDHWSTLLYLESCAVDQRGLIKNEKMRCLDRVHREFSHGHDASSAPTRLKNGDTTSKHDDWSCLEDAAISGLLRAEFRRENDAMFGNSKARISLTDWGWEMTAALRKHLGSGGTYDNFVPLRIGG